jgi:hypothetical protein
MEAELFYADKQTNGHPEMTNLIVADRNFEKALKNYTKI